MRLSNPTYEGMSTCRTDSKQARNCGGPRELYDVVAAREQPAR